MTGSSCPSPLQFELDDAPEIEVLLAAYLDPVGVYALSHPPTEDLEDKVQREHQSGSTVVRTCIVLSRQKNTTQNMHILVC